MEIRCEKCHTEYELDDSRLTEAGVTVKCTNCGNLFKIRRRTQGEATSLGLEGGDDRLWLLRSPEGTVRHFRELKTLQQWIIERKVSRDHEISRSGEVWKRLGEVTELASFFSAVEEAHGLKERPATLAGPPVSHASREPVLVAPEPVISSRASTVPAAPPPAVVPHAPLRAETVPSVAPPPPPPPISAAAASRETWKGTALELDNEPLAGSPLAGILPSEPAWAQGGGPRPQTSGSNLPPTAMINLNERDDLFVPRRQSSLPLFAIVGGVAAVAGLAIWWFALRVPAEPAAALPHDAAVKVATLPPDAAAVASVPKPVVAPIVPDAAVVADPFAEAIAKYDEDTPEGYAETERLLSEIKSDDAAVEARALGWRALSQAAWAQALLDQSKLGSDATRARALEAEAATHLKTAEKLARDGLKRLEGIAEPLVALAEVQRQKGRADEAEKLLGRVSDVPESLYVRGLLRADAGKPDGAAMLEQAVLQREQSGRSKTHVQARWRLALLLAAPRPEDAKAQLRALLAAQPQHARAQLLLSQLEAPLPDAGVAATKPPDGEEDEPQGYERLVARGDRRAENGDCSGATRDYERALDVRPSGVEALTGLGYCFLDAGQHSRAMSNFRAALGISPRYGEALIGLAESYRYQGKKEEAAAQYRKYLEVQPNGPKASIARRQLEALGVAEKPPEPKPPEPTPEQKPPDPKPPEPEQKPPEPKPPEPVPESKPPPPPEPKPPEPSRPAPKPDPNAPNVPAPDSPGGQ